LLAKRARVKPLPGRRLQERIQLDMDSAETRIQVLSSSDEARIF
jgi:hypothetical protein